MSQPNKDRDGLPAPSPSASVSSYLVRMESAINPAASANGDTLAAHLSVTQSREKYNDSDRAQGRYDVKDVASSLVEDDHSFNDRDDEDDGAIVLHRSVESLGGDGYVPTIHDDHDDTPHHDHDHHDDRVVDDRDLNRVAARTDHDDRSYPSSAQIMAAVRDSSNSATANTVRDSTVASQIAPPTWVTSTESFITFF